MTETHRNRYFSVYETLKLEITNGKIATGSRLPSDTILAERFEVSRPTVAKAVKMLHDQGLIERRAGALSLVIGKPEKKQKAHSFGLLIPDLVEREIFEAICNQIAVLSSEYNFTLLWEGTTKFSDEGSMQLLESVDRYIDAGVDGIFFTPLEDIYDGKTINQKLLTRLEANGITVILLDRESSSFPKRSCHDLVAIDNLDAGYQVAEHLIEKGCKRICFLMRKGLASTISMRRQGVELAIKNSSLGPESLLTISLDPTIEQAINQIIESEIDGLICYNDALAAEVMLMLLARGVSIPEQMLVAGFDDVKYAKLLRVPLTTVKHPSSAVGEEAVKVMFERLHAPEAPSRKVELKSNLVIRQSTTRG